MMKNKAEISQEILNVIQKLQAEPSEWVELAQLGILLGTAGIQYKEYGFYKLKHFLNEFTDILEFKNVEEEGKPPVSYVRPKTEAKTEEIFTDNSIPKETPIFNGKILWIKSDETGGFCGCIEAQDQQTYKFNAGNWINKKLTVFDICIGGEVEFEVKENGIFANRIRFKGEAVNVDTVIKNSNGVLGRFVYLKLFLLKGVLANISGEFEECEILERIRDTYARLSDADFNYSSDNKTLVFPSGFEKDGEKIYLYCKRNLEPGKSPWLCEEVKYNGQVMGGSVFDRINANWYDMLSDLKKFVPNALEDVEAEDVAAHIAQRCMKEKALVWLKKGRASTEGNADTLLAPTGYYYLEGDEEKEIFLSCSRGKGIKGYGWYYEHIMYENAPVDKVCDRKDWLRLWAEIEWEDVCSRIAAQTLEEKWSFGDRNDYGILRNYINYIYVHQRNKGAVCLSKDGKYAVFNTGLPEKNTYKYIYAFFERLESEIDRHPLGFAPEYQLKDFVVTGRGGNGKILQSAISPLPSPPRFFKARSATVWELEFNADNQPALPEFDDCHILIHRCDRIPLEFYYCAERRSERFSNILNAQTTDEQKYKEIRDFLRPVFDEKADDEVAQVYQELYSELREVIHKAVCRLSWNWRAVVPSYNPERDEPCFLLPVSFDPKSNRPDRAMIASAKENGDSIVYQIHTVISLEWAYLDARLVCRPESEWLAPDNI